MEFGPLDKYGFWGMFIYPRPFFWTSYRPSIAVVEFQVVFPFLIFTTGSAMLPFRLLLPTSRIEAGLTGSLREFKYYVQTLETGNVFESL